MCKVNLCSRSFSITTLLSPYAIIAISPTDRDSLPPYAAGELVAWTVSDLVARRLRIGREAPPRITYLHFASVAAGAQCEQVMRSGLRSAIRGNQVILSFEGLLTHNSGKIDR